MADTADPLDTTAQGATGDRPRVGRRLLPLLMTLAAAPILGGAAFYAVHSGLILASPPGTNGRSDIVDAAFVPVPPMVISLGPAAGNRHLRFGAQIEVARGQTTAVQTLMPRFADVLNGYLRAVDVADLEQPASLLRLRAQMLRRLQVIAGDGRIRDLLITEFVLN